MLAVRPPSIKRLGSLRTFHAKRNSAIQATDKVKLVNPATEEPIGEYSSTTPKELEEKFAKAKAVQKNWAGLTLNYRKQVISNFHKRIFDNKERLATLLSDEMGKPVSQAAGEINATLGRIKFFLSHVDEAIGDKLVNQTENWNPSEKNQVQEIIRYDPLGVIANISAWNYPWFVGTNVIVPALLAGNAVLYKPSEHTLQTGLAIAGLLTDSGVPADLFSVVIGGGSIGQQLVQLPVAGVFFTGSYATGKRITESLGNKWARLQLELGGKDPAYVRADANLQHAVSSTVEGAFWNTGQSCCSVERIYVHEEIYGRFLNEYVAQVKSFYIGQPSHPKTFIGPLARKEQIAVLESQVKDAVSKGAKLLCGGSATKVQGRGWYFQPTVLADCNSTMSVMRDESFGPIIGIQSVSSDDEAFQLMNDCEYGLTASVYSSRKEEADNILQHLETGTSYWNASDRVSPYLPWSGRRNSGIGFTLSSDGIKCFTNPRGWHYITNPV
eukprot:TRINITY_DN2538_c0_g1_i1.p1 TRINITY_DN2538_c0_g1~~TRINITY_DN2538_c0_g1_i1.p1  ORF type:complete len:498 (-),score=118.30 TRINITY_DN2538_c0_g1_i1:115-1608(-)